MFRHRRRIARSTRKTRPSAASGYQAMIAPKVSKITVHAADSPSASQCACSAHREIDPQNAAFGCNRLSSGYQAMFAPKVSKITVHAADF